MSDPVEYKVEHGESGRVDIFLRSRLTDVGRRWIGALFHGGHIRINGRTAKKGDHVAVGATVCVAQLPPKPGSIGVLPDPDRALEILHETAHVVIVAKPAGIPSHPLKPGERNTLANALVARYPECEHVGRDPREAGLAHRLDTGTSGLLMCARDTETWRILREAFRCGRVHKSYLALIAGEIDHEGTIMASLVQRGRRVFVDDVDGLPSETQWTVVGRSDGYALVRCQSTTGRMHQIRAHLAHLGAPIVGDTLYGGPVSTTVIGHFLHADHLSVETEGVEHIKVHAPLPIDRQLGLKDANISP